MWFLFHPLKQSLGSFLLLSLFVARNSFAHGCCLFKCCRHPKLLLKLRNWQWIFLKMVDPSQICLLSYIYYLFLFTLVNHRVVVTNHPILTVEDAFPQDSHPLPWLIDLLLHLAVKNSLYLVNLVMIGIFYIYVLIISLYLDVNLKSILAKSVICWLMGNLMLLFLANFPVKCCFLFWD